MLKRFTHHKTEAVKKTSTATNPTSTRSGGIIRNPNLLPPVLTCEEERVFSRGSSITGKLDLSPDPSINIIILIRCLLGPLTDQPRKKIEPPPPQVKSSPSSSTSVPRPTSSSQDGKATKTERSHPNHPLDYERVVLGGPGIQTDPNTIEVIPLTEDETDTC